MSKVKDIIKEMELGCDENGWSGHYHKFYYAEGGTVGEVINKLLNKINSEKRHRKRRYIKFNFPYEINLN